MKLLVNIVFHFLEGSNLDIMLCVFSIEYVFISFILTKHIRYMMKQGEYFLSSKFQIISLKLKKYLDYLRY